MKTTIPKDPFLTRDFSRLFPKDAEYFPGLWPAKWVVHAQKREPPFVNAYRLRFHLGNAAKLRFHASADERYQLFLDGRRIGRGPDRGDRENWFFDTYETDAVGGPHLLVAMVWSAGNVGPSAQITVAPGFLLAADEPSLHAVLNTGVAPWESRSVEGISFVPSYNTWLAGNTFGMDASAYPWGVEKGEGALWSAVIAGPYARSCGAYDKWGGGEGQRLRPSLIPPMLEQRFHTGKMVHVSAVENDDTRPVAIVSAHDLAAEHPSWTRLLAGNGPVRVPARTQRRILIDLGDYYCAYTMLVTGGGRGATVRIGWAEALYTEAQCHHHSPKGNRNEIEGRFFLGVADEFKPDGGVMRTFEPLWWKAGRFIEIYIHTRDEELSIENFRLTETRYPGEPQSTFVCSEKRMEAIIPIMVRSLQMCSHETFMDCPYYEQLMYIGDTRLEALISLATSRDNRLVKKSVEMFAASRRESGLTRSCYPARGTQIIPTFSLWWCAMLHDYALWRGEQEFVRRFMPMARDIIDIHVNAIDPKDGLFVSLPGWNYMDWTRDAAWDTGVPPDGKAGGKSAMINWQLAYALVHMAELEEWIGERELAARDRRLAGNLAKACVKAYWNDTRGLFADDRKHRYYSEHTQCLALLSGLAGKIKDSAMTRSLCDDRRLTRTTIYFSHYLFETMRQTGRIDKVFERLQEWYDLAANGMKTTRENPEPTRSDCHAWGAHPLFHYYSSIAGIRPGSMGFKTVVIAPQMGKLGTMKTSMVHPDGGFIKVDLKQGSDGLVSGVITLPKKLPGVFVGKRRKVTLKPGKNALTGV